MESLFCEWLNRLIAIDKGSGTIRIKRLTQTHSNSERFDFQIFNEGQHINEKCLLCQNILDSCTGWRSPHLLVAHTPQQNLTTHELMVCTSDGYFESCGLQFDIKGADLPSDGRYHLLDGPTVVWQQATHVHIVHGQNMEVKMVVDVQKMAPHHLTLKGIQNMWCILSDDTDGCPIVLLLVQLLLLTGAESSNSREFGGLEWMCLQVRLQDDMLLGLPGMKTTKIPNLVPSDYGCIATCITSHKSFRVDHSTGAMRESLLFVVGTRYQQVVLIEDGTVRSVISLLTLPQHIVAVKGSRGDVEVAVMSSDSTVCVYQVTDAGAKEKGKWTGVSACVPGDFSLRGHSQILLLGDKDQGNTFYMNEENILSSIAPSDDEGEHVSEGALMKPPESLLNVLKAVQLKKHTESACLTHHKLTLQHKVDLLSRSLGFMESLGEKGAKRSNGMKTNPSSPSLVCLFPGKLDTPTTSSSSPSPPSPSNGGDLGRLETEQPPSELQVLKVWQRLHAGKWIVGIVMRNNSEKVLTGVGASLVWSCDPLPKESSCRVIWSEPYPLKSQALPPSLVVADAPPKKKRRLEVLISAMKCSEETQDFDPVECGHAFCLGVATEEQLPGTTAVLVVHWWTTGEAHSGELTRVQLTTRSVCSGELSIDEKCLSLWNGSLALSGDDKFHTKDVQDLVCLLASCSLTQVQVSADYTHLSRLPAMIRARLPLPEHALQSTSSFSTPTSHHNHHPPTFHHHHSCSPRLHQSSKILESTAIYIRPQSKTAAVVSILHKSQSHLELVLKLLTSSLPKDIRMCVFCGSEKTQHRALLHSLGAIRTEAADRVKALNTALEESGETMLTAGPGEPRLALDTDTKVKSLSIHG